jgi:V8-like Glu-specific endopeptidase
MRLAFSEVQLSGNPLDGSGSYLRVTSLRDGSEQILNAVHVDQWKRTTAYFNGDEVLVEVVGTPGTGANRVVLESVTVGEPVFEESQCGPTDDRAPSSDPRSARLLPIGCTGWTIQDCQGCFLTAGHCSSGISVAQFNVPSSTSSGSLQHPPATDQYAVDSRSIQSSGSGGVGNDYAYFGCFANSSTGRTPVQAQGPGFVTRVPTSPAGGDQIRITGYGTDSTPLTRNQTQQTHVGPYAGVFGTEVSYTTDTEGGNSGSPIIFEGTDEAVGIHTHGGCISLGVNFGTSFGHAGLQNFLNNPTGVCAVACGACGRTATVQTRNAGSNPASLTGNAAALGQPFVTQVDLAGTTGHPRALVLGFVTPANIPLSGGRVLLVDVNDPNGELLTFGFQAGTRPTFTRNVPADTVLCGQRFSVQAVHLGGGVPYALSNALDLVIGD